jgi:membrane protein
LSEGIQALLAWGRWPLLVALVVFGLAVLYRYGPDRDQPQWRWVSWGAVIAFIEAVNGRLSYSYRFALNLAGGSSDFADFGQDIHSREWLVCNGEEFAS